MREFKYEIKYDEHNEPYVIVPQDYTDTIEDKFMMVSLVSYLMKNVLDEKKLVYGEKEVSMLENTVEFLDGVAYNLGQLMTGENLFADEMKETINQEPKSSEEIKEEDEYHIVVDKVKDRNELPKHNIIHNDRIFEREEGLRVYVKSTGKIYELRGGVSNNKWVLYKKI